MKTPQLDTSNERPATATAADPGVSREPDERHERQRKVVEGGESARVASIAEAIVLKSGEPFFLCERDGQVPLDDGHGLGLYYRDCRYLSGYEIRIADGRTTPLSADASAADQALFRLTNPEIRLPDGRAIPKASLSIALNRRVSAAPPALEDTISITNHGEHAFDCPIDLEFAADFRDVFEIRGMYVEDLGQRREPAWSDEGRLLLAYAGADGIDRRLEISIDPAPEHGTDPRARIHLELAPGATHTATIRVGIEEHVVDSKGGPTEWARRTIDGRRDDWLGDRAVITSDSLVVERSVERGLRDLGALTTAMGGERYFAAGVPWFVTLFGRDSLITALEMLPYRPAVGTETLRLLARYQGRNDDPWRDEEPGKILHELRIGEFARLGLIPHTPYYGSIDSTPLFLILLGRTVAWTGDLGLFDELHEVVEHAIAWMTGSADDNGDGLLEYQTRSERGLVNQGWKDSGDAIVNASGELAQPPISLVEVQAYAYRAFVEMAALFARAGDEAKAQELDDRARTLREAVETRFWDDDLGLYVLALQEGGRPVAVPTSNAGQVLWTGLSGDDHARRTSERLMQDDMFSGWGIRTLSADARRYNPIGYHLGTVWPHDTALVCDGFRRYGHDGAALRVFEGLLEAGLGFEGLRLPEAMAGFAREASSVPVPYPVACHPQAWASGAIPMLVASLLGLDPDGLAGRLRIVRPVLPSTVDRLDLDGLRVGGGTADLRFERVGERIEVDVRRADGVEVEVVPDGRLGPVDPATRPARSVGR